MEGGYLYGPACEGRYRSVAAVEGSFCGGCDGQAVSSTAQLPPGADPRRIADNILVALGSVKGVTAFPAVSRPKSPYEAITEDQYHAMVAALGVDDVTDMVGDSNTGVCATGACPVR